MSVFPALFESVPLFAASQGDDLWKQLCRRYVVFS